MLKGAWSNIQKLSRSLSLLETLSIRKIGDFSSIGPSNPSLLRLLYALQSPNQRARSNLTEKFDLSSPIRWRKNPSSVRLDKEERNQLGFLHFLAWISKGCFVDSFLGYPISGIWGSGFYFAGECSMDLGVLGSCKCRREFRFSEEFLLD